MSMIPERDALFKGVLGKGIDMKKSINNLQSIWESG
jgi:hypothetical protein